MAYVEYPRLLYRGDVWIKVFDDADRDAKLAAGWSLRVPGEPEPEQPQAAAAFSAFVEPDPSVAPKHGRPKGKR